MNLPEVMPHIKYQLLKLNIGHPRAAQNLGHIGTSISYFLSRNHEVSYKLHAYNEYNYDKHKDNRKTVVGYNVILIISPLYSHQSVLILIKELEYVLVKDKLF